MSLVHRPFVLPLSISQARQTDAITPCPSPFRLGGPVCRPLQRLSQLYDRCLPSSLGSVCPATAVGGRVRRNVVLLGDFPVLDSGLSGPIQNAMYELRLGRRRQAMELRAGGLQFGVSVAGLSHHLSSPCFSLSGTIARNLLAQGHIPSPPCPLALRYVCAEI